MYVSPYLMIAISLTLVPIGLSVHTAHKAVVCIAHAGGLTRALTRALNGLKQNI